MGREYTGKPKRRGGIVLLVALLVVAALLAAGYFSLKSAYEKSLGPIEPGNTEGITVQIPAGATTAAISEILEQNGLVERAYFFRYYSKQAGHDGQYKQGTFTLSRSMGAGELAAALMAGNSAETKRFTIPEGYNTIQVAKSLAEQGICSEEEFWDEVRTGEFDYAFLAGCPEGDGRLEGFLYPETYEVYASGGAHDAIAKMLGQFDKLFLPLYYERANGMGRSVRDIVTMGSIIERESVVASERPIMSGVFYNRLDKGMRLESCATIQYILGEPKEFLTNADLAIESPYNTYLHDGLPPGPICNPRMASIEAALYPDENDFVFFVLSPSLDGSHNFSADYNEFLRNKDAYYKVAEG